MRPETIPPSRRWVSQSAGAIQDIADTDGSIVVIPVGSVEQHGDHLPVGTDSMLVSAVVGDAVERLDADMPVLVTQTVWGGYSPHHLSFGGTLSVGFRNLLGVLEDVASTAAGNGFDAVLLVNGHGGNKPVIAATVNTVGNALPDIDVLGITYFDLAAEFVDEIRESDPGGMGHAGEFETALMAHRYPELVDMEEAEGATVTEPYARSSVDLIESEPLQVHRPFEAYAENGVIGEPGLASAEKGERIFDELASRLADVLRDVHAQHAC